MTTSAKKIYNIYKTSVLKFLYIHIYWKHRKLIFIWYYLMLLSYTVCKPYRLLYCVFLSVLNIWNIHICLFLYGNNYVCGMYFEISFPYMYCIYMSIYECCEYFFPSTFFLLNQTQLTYWNSLALHILHSQSSKNTTFLSFFLPEKRIWCFAQLTFWLKLFSFF